MLEERNKLVDLDDDEDDDGSESWLASYSDMMTDILAIFVILFSFAMMSVAQQNVNIRKELQEEQELSSSQSYEIQQANEEFDRVFQLIKEKIEESGHSDSILLDRDEGYIKFRFKDNVLFYPDSPTMKETSYDILKYMGDLLLDIDKHIKSIEISGHTAKVDGKEKINVVAWKLSSDRALSVLKFLVNQCDLPQNKMVISGYSHYNPVADNSNEKDRSLNRRVEIKIIRIGTSNDEIFEPSNN
jgi:chemotaxis protein MotB